MGTVKFFQYGGFSGDRLRWSDAPTFLRIFEFVVIHTVKAETSFCWQRSIQVKLRFFSVIMYRCESWTIKKAENWRTDALELWCWKRLLRIAWTARDQTGQSERKYQPWVFIGRTDAEAEAPKLCPPDVKSQLIGKDPDAGKDWKQEEKGSAEDEMII